MAVAAAVRFACTKGAARAAFYASKEVKKTLRGLIYRKLLRLGAAYDERAHRRGGAACGRGHGTA